MRKIELSSSNKSIFLGTALWGWGIEKKEAFSMLDKFVELGGKFVDTAANYPINKKPVDFGLAVNWLSEWLKSGNSTSLSILIKVGGKDNLGGSEAFLEESYLLSSVEKYQNMFGSALSGIGIHFDNRSDEYEILKTVNVFKDLYNTGYDIGFSGIKFPDLYFKAAPALKDKWIIQVKENALTSEARHSYNPYFPDSHYVAYGINMGGIKLDEPDSHSSIKIRNIKRTDELVNKMRMMLEEEQKSLPLPTDLNEFALKRTYANSALSGLIIGPRNVHQLDNSMTFWNLLTKSSL